MHELSLFKINRTRDSHAIYSLKGRCPSGIGIPSALRGSDDRLRLIIGIPIWIRCCLASYNRPRGMQHGHSRHENSPRKDTCRKIHTRVQWRTSKSSKWIKRTTQKEWQERPTVRTWNSKLKRTERNVWNAEDYNVQSKTTNSRQHKDLCEKEGWMGWSI